MFGWPSPVDKWTACGQLAVQEAAAAVPDDEDDPEVVDPADDEPEDDEPAEDDELDFESELEPDFESPPDEEDEDPDGAPVFLPFVSARLSLR